MVVSCRKLLKGRRIIYCHFEIIKFLTIINKYAISRPPAGVVGGFTPGKISILQGLKVFFLRFLQTFFLDLGHQLLQQCLEIKSDKLAKHCAYN